MKTHSMVIRNEGGNVTLIAMMVICLLTAIGISGAKTANIEKQSATNEHLNKLAFFAGEAARAYVMMEPELYGVNNLDFANSFKLPYDSADPTNGTGGERVDLGNGQSFDGDVQYRGPRTPPRGSGFDTSSYSAHEYRMVCLGDAGRNATANIYAGFYRIGF